jgi:hypothetical protein
MTEIISSTTSTDLDEVSENTRVYFQEPESKKIKPNGYLFRGHDERFLSPTILEDMPSSGIFHPALKADRATKLVLISALRADLSLCEDLTAMDYTIGMLAGLLDPKPDEKCRYRLDRKQSILESPSDDPTGLCIVFTNERGERIEFSLLAPSTGRLSSVGLGRSAESASARLAGQGVSADVASDCDYGVKIDFSGHLPNSAAGLELRCVNGSSGVKILGYESIWDGKWTDTAHSKVWDFNEFVGDELKKNINGDKASMLNNVVVAAFFDIVKRAKSHPVKAKS